MSNRLTHSTRSHHQKASQKSNSWKRNAAFASFAATVRSIKIAMRRGIVIGRRFFFSLPPHSLLTIHTANCSRFVSHCIRNAIRLVRAAVFFFFFRPPYAHHSPARWFGSACHDKLCAFFGLHCLPFLPSKWRNVWCCWHSAPIRYIYTRNECRSTLFQIDGVFLRWTCAIRHFHTFHLWCLFCSHFTFFLFLLILFFSVLSVHLQSE